jgi:hypothetical protein
MRMSNGCAERRAHRRLGLAFYPACVRAAILLGRSLPAGRRPERTPLLPAKLGIEIVVTSVVPKEYVIRHGYSHAPRLVPNGKHFRLGRGSSEVGL